MIATMMVMKITIMKMKTAMLGVVTLQLKEIGS